MQAFITKYALTEGIMEVQDAQQYQGSTDMISVPSMGFTAYFHGSLNEWQTTKALAIAQAELMRQRKIVSLKKKIQTLKSLTFT
jgi:hypothetical protein